MQEVKRKTNMNFPALARKTFEEFKDDPIFRGMVKKALAFLAKLNGPVRRTEWIHEQIDHSLEKLFKDPTIQQHVSCKKGCNSCCHSQVSVTEDEADVLADKILKEDYPLDLNRLKIQSKAKNEAADWYRISFKDRRCVFLNDAGECSVYKDRPSVCRTNFVVSDPKDCSTENGKEKSLRMLKTHEADMLVMAQFMHSQRNGSLPYMLVQSLDKKLNKKTYRKNIDK